MLNKEPFENFLIEHFVFSLNVVEDGNPYSAPCFYVYNPDEKKLVFVSDPKTYHIRSAVKHPRVSGSVYRETERIHAIQGLQFTGRFLETDTEEKKRMARRLFCGRFPYARLQKTPFWLIQLEWVKFTDNSRGFGFKEIWELNPKS